MQGKNRYFRRSRLSEAKFRTIMRYFTHDLLASKLAALSDVSHPTINQRFFKLRPRIAQLCDASSPFSSELEVDESSFGARHVRGKKGRGGAGASPFFAKPERGSVRFRAKTMGRRPLPSAARVRPGAHSARRQDSRNDLTPYRMAWHFVSDGAHAPHSDQTLGPTPTRGRRTSLVAFAPSLPCAPPG